MMRIDPAKRLRHVADEHIVIMQKGGVADMTTVVGLNESAVLLHEVLSGRDFDMEDVAEALLENYEVEAATARTDAAEWVEQMREFGLLVG